MVGSEERFWKYILKSRFFFWTGFFGNDRLLLMLTEHVSVGAHSSHLRSLIAFKKCLITKGESEVEKLAPNK